MQLFCNIWGQCWHVFVLLSRGYDKNNNHVGTYFKDTEASSQLANDAGLFQNLTHCSHWRLLFWLHAATRHNPIVRPTRRRHKQHLRTKHTIASKFTLLSLIFKYKLHANLRFGVWPYAYTSRAAPKPFIVVYPNRIRLLLNHFEKTRKHEQNRQLETKSRHQTESKLSTERNYLVINKRHNRSILR